MTNDESSPAQASEPTKAERDIARSVLIVLPPSPVSIA